MGNTGNITIKQLNYNEALKFLGYKDNHPDEKTYGLLLACEKELLKAIEGKYIYKVFELVNGQIPNIQFILEGREIQNHLKNCEKVIFLSATIGNGVDALIRKKQITGMTESMVLDSLASVAVEQICDEAQQKILEGFHEYEHTWRFGLGYGDFPISGQKKFLEILDAPKRIGVCVNEAMMLTPTKSVTCVIGLGHGLEKSKKQSCEICSLKEQCQLRKDGIYCGK